MPKLLAPHGKGDARMSRPIERRVHDLLTWLEKQRLAHADMVTDAGDASIWCREEAERITDHAQTVIDLNELRLLSDEADFIRHEGGAESVAAMEEAMRDTVLPLLRRNAEDLLRCVAVGADPATISGSDWRDIADDLEAVLTVERFVGRPDDEYGRVLDPVLDAASWREHT